MPFVRISLLRSLPVESKKSISQVVHQSLMDHFNVPADDYFHVLEELETTQLYYPENYLGIPHSGNMVYVQIFAGSGRNADQKKGLYDSIARDIAQKTAISANDVIILLIENGGKENWSFGKGEIQEIRHIH